MKRVLTPTCPKPTVEELSLMPQEMLTFLVHRLLDPKGGMQVYSPNPETRLLTLHFCNECG